jgi:hypothetical protein
MIAHRSVHALDTSGERTGQFGDVGRCQFRRLVRGSADSNALRFRETPGDARLDGKIDVLRDIFGDRRNFDRVEFADDDADDPPGVIQQRTAAVAWLHRRRNLQDAAVVPQAGQSRDIAQSIQTPRFARPDGYCCAGQPRRPA